MKNDPFFYTAAVAGLCARQGYLEKSAEIYAFLLEREPQRQDLQQALDDVTARLSQTDVKSAPPPSSSENHLESLVGTWVSLLVENNLRQKFDALRDSIKRITPKP